LRIYCERKNIYPLRRDKSACDLPKGRKLADNQKNYGVIGLNFAVNGKLPRKS
jgi:hypothetical protein